MVSAVRFPRTGFDAGALQAMKPGMPATGALVSPSSDPVAGYQSSHLAAAGQLPLAKRERLGALRDVISKIEGHARLEQAQASVGPSGGVPEGVAGDCPAAASPGWSFGCSAMDLKLPGGLACDSVHEVKASAHPSGASAGDWMAGLGFALRLAVRRQRMLAAGEGGSGLSGGRQVSGQAGHQPWLMWCSTRAFAAEYGRLSHHGLQQLGIDPAGVLIVETAREDEALQALEEGLRCKSLGLVCGVFDDVGLTPARRLSLAAASGTPCLLVTHPASPATAATAVRFSVSRQRSGVNRLDPKTPGKDRFAVRIDRCRAMPRLAGRPSLPLEWCDDAGSFNLAAGVGDRAFGAGGPFRRACG